METSSSNISALHQALVDQLKKQENIRTARVEAAFRAVPRHLFLPGVALDKVYSDQAIPTKHSNGAAISSSSQPAIMAIMLEQLELQPGQHVLEIGAGTGYNAALIAYIVGGTGQVVTVDIDDDIVQSAREHLYEAGFVNVQTFCGDGGLGYSDAAPYDRIILTVGAGDIAPAWREQLNPNGRLVLPLTLKGGVQESIAFEKIDGHLKSISIKGCGFMMLRGAFASPGNDLSLGEEPGLVISTEDQSVMDAKAAYELLIGPSRVLPSGIQVKSDEFWGGLKLWLALHEPGFCNLRAHGKATDRGLVPCLFGSGGEWKYCVTSGVISASSLCVLMRPPDSPLPWDCPENSSPFELFVKSFGSDDSLARHLIEQVKAWDAAGRPNSNGLSVKAFPKDRAYIPAAREIVIDKRWTRIVLDWK